MRYIRWIFRMLWFTKILRNNGNPGFGLSFWKKKYHWSWMDTNTHLKWRCFDFFFNWWCINNFNKVDKLLFRKTNCDKYVAFVHESLTHCLNSGSSLYQCLLRTVYYQYKLFYFFNLNTKHTIKIIHRI